MSIDVPALESAIRDGIYGDDRMTEAERGKAFDALNTLLLHVHTLEDSARRHLTDARLIRMRVEAQNPADTVERNAREDILTLCGFVEGIATRAT